MRVDDAAFETLTRVIDSRLPEAKRGCSREDVSWPEWAAGFLEQAKKPFGAYVDLGGWMVGYRGRAVHKERRTRLQGAMCAIRLEANSEWRGIGAKVRLDDFVLQSRRVVKFDFET